MASITAKNSVTSNFSVSFSIPSGTSGQIKAEVDSRTVAEGGTNANTSFKPGDNVSWLLFKNSDVTIIDIISSEGSNISAGSLEYSVDEMLTLGGAFDTNLSYPFYSDFTAEWIGSGGIKATITPPAVGSSLITLSSLSAMFAKYGAIGIIHVTYKAKADNYILKHSALPYPKYDIIVYIAGEVPA